MAIEWAPISLDGSRNAAARKHARSLAMRQFRQRQKEDADRLDDSMPDSGATTASSTRKRLCQGGRGGTSQKSRVNNNAGEIKGSSLVFKATSCRNDAEDRVQDPKVMAESLLLCKRYLQWLRPDQKLSDADFAIFVTQQPLPDPLLIAASCLVAVRYLDAAHFRVPSQHNAERKSEILQILNARLHDSGTPASADVVNAVVCLLHFELCEGSHEALVHLQGIKALMKAAEPLNDYAFASCSMSLEMGDLIHALMFSRKPEFVPIERQDPRLQSTYSSYHVPFLAQELQQTDRLSGFTHVGSKMQAVSNDIKRSFDMPIDSDENGMSMLLNAPSGETVRSHDPSPHPPDEFSNRSLFVQAAQAGSNIIYRYAVQRRPLNDNENQALLEPIIRAMIEMPNQQWQSLKYFRLFLLLTATCVSEEQSRRSFCEAHLVRAMLQIGPEEWDSTRTFFTKYIDNVNAVRAS